VAAQLDGGTGTGGAGAERRRGEALPRVEVAGVVVVVPVGGVVVHQIEPAAARLRWGLWDGARAPGEGARGREARASDYQQPHRYTCSRLIA
jgi:hypothetical protein